MQAFKRSICGKVEITTPLKTTIIPMTTTIKQIVKTPGFLFNALNLVKKHPRRLATTGVFCSFYLGTAYSAMSWENEVLRIGIAGSVACIICDSCFHVVDTVNIRAKAMASGVKGEHLPKSTLNFVKSIWAKEGIAGFAKGYSACFYSSASVGFVYFVIYKVMKDVVKERLSEGSDLALCYLLSSLISQVLCLSIEYPYDLVKCRL